jgi:ADP-ribosyl-[dinitrogen reductase] hydrolase
MFALRRERAARISWLRHPSFTGAIGLTRLPGAWFNALETDLEAIRASGASTLVSLVGTTELHRTGADDFGASVAAAGLAWHHLPIRDFGVPNQQFETVWAVSGPALRRRLVGGEKVVIHCFAGLGRSGMVAARLLVEMGEQPAKALDRVRAARPGAVQTAEQEAHLHRIVPHGG